MIQNSLSIFDLGVFIFIGKRFKLNARVQMITFVQVSQAHFDLSEEEKETKNEEKMSNISERQKKRETRKHIEEGNECKRNMKKSEQIEKYLAFFRQ